MTCGIEWIDALESELTDMGIVGIVDGYVPWLVGPEHVNATQEPPRYVLLPGGDVPEATPDLAFAGANPPAVASVREGAMVYCEGRDYAEARILRNNLILALDRQLRGIYSVTGGDYGSPTVALNVGCRRYAFRIACSIPVVEQVYPLATRPLSVHLDGGFDRPGVPVTETTTFDEDIVINGE